MPVFSGFDSLGGAGGAAFDGGQQLSGSGDTAAGLNSGDKTFNFGFNPNANLFNSGNNVQTVALVVAVIGVVYLMRK